MLEALNYEGLTAAHAQDEAVVCALHFERVRDKLLMMYAWKFVRAVNTPTANELPGNTGWKYYFPKPADCLFVLGVIDVGNGGVLTEYEELSNSIHTNAKIPTLVYTSSATNVTEWPSLFIEAFICSLAAEIAPAVTGEIANVKYCQEKAERAISEARKLGIISSDITSTLPDELKKRALNLARGQRTISPTSEAAITTGLDVSGRVNYRTQQEEQACLRAYDSVRDRLLELYAWTFARKSAACSGVIGQIAGWIYSAGVPSDCVKVLSVLNADGEPEDYEIADGYVNCNVSPARIRYTAKMTDAEKWPGIFRDVFCYELAAEILTVSSGDIQGAQALREHAQRLIHEAERTGAIRGEVKIPASVELYNRAISLVRGQRTISPTGQTVNEQGLDIIGDMNYREREAIAVCRRSLPELRDKLLRLYGWKFARKTAELTLASKKSGWNYAYNIPSDCMKVLSVLSNDEPAEYEEADGLILSNASGDMTVRYTRRVTELTELDSVFREILCLEVAIEVSNALIMNVEHIALLEQKKTAIIENAYRTGIITEDTPLTLKEEMYNRAIHLAHGTRTLKGTSEQGNNAGADTSGQMNVRNREEIAACKRAAPSVRDRLLQLYPWTFARHTSELTQEAVNVSGWTNGYVLPSDCLQVLSVLHNDEPIDYEAIDTRVYCNASGVTVRYTARVVSMDKLPGVFVDVYCYALAEEVISATTGNNEQIALLEQKKQALIVDAYKIGAIKTESRIPAKHELYNRAIGLVRGQKQGITPDMKMTRYEDEISTCRRSFDGVRDRLLTLYAWVFARKTETPARLSENVPGWRYTYALPADCLKVNAVIAHDRRSDYGLERGCMGVSDFSENVELAEWEISGHELYTNREAIYIRYTARIEDYAKWAALFTEAFVAMLAIEVAMNVTDERNIITILDQRIARIIDEAKQNGTIREDTKLPKQKESRRTSIKTTPYLDYSGIPTLPCTPIDYCGRSYGINADEFCQW